MVGQLDVGSDGMERPSLTKMTKPGTLPRKRTKLGTVPRRRSG
jgi:hypothetical protein